MKDKLLNILQESDRKVVLKEVEILRTAPTFNDYADIWAPGLYKLDPVFFKSFIKYNLRRDLHRNKPFMKELLSLADNQKDFDLYQWLYPFIYNQKKWNEELKNSCNLSDTKLFEESIEKLTLNNFWTIDEPVAVALYKKNPSAVKQIILSALPFRWGNQSMLKELRKLVKENKDEALYFSLYKRLGNINDWLEAIDDLVKAKKKDNIIEELENITLENWFGYSQDTIKIFDKVYDNFGKHSLPYLKRHMNFIRFVKQNLKDNFLAKIKQKESENDYMEMFTLICDPKQWLNKIDEILSDKRISKVTKIYYLHYLSSSGGNVRYYALTEDVALKIFELSPEILIKYFSNNMNNPYPELYNRAVATNNQDLEDIIIINALKITYWRIQKEKNIQEFHNNIINNLEALRVKSVSEFVKRISIILSRFEAYDIWNLKSLQTKNQLVNYVFTTPNELWLNHPEYIRDLLESPNIFVQIKAFEILKLKDSRVIQPIKTNIDILLATILKRYYKRTLTLLFEVLEYGIVNDPDIARIAMPKLMEALTIRAKKYPRDKIIALLGRLKYYNPELAAHYI